MYEETVITAKCAQDTFSCKGKTVLSSGWKMVEAGSGYVKRKGKNLIPTTEGKNLISVVPVPFKSPSMTADWENALLQIEKGTLSTDTFIAGITKMVRDLVTSTPSPTAEQLQLFSSSAKTKDSVGVCPWCGSDVYDGKSSYYCSSRECRFCL